MGDIYSTPIDMSSDILASDKNIAQWLICARMNWWAAAIDHLLEMRGFTKTRLDEIRDTDGKPKVSHRQLLRAYQGAYGPSVAVLKRLLDAIGASWHDWAIACEKAQMKTVGSKPHLGKPVKKNIKTISNGE